MPNAVRTIEMPYSEACMALGVAGKPMTAELVGPNAVQLWQDGREFSFPITRGEAGWLD